MGIKLIIQLLVNGISLGAVYAIVAVGFALIFSVLKFSNFAHGGTISATAYLAFFFQRMFNPAPPLWVTVIFAAAAGAAISWALDSIGYRSIRRRESPLIYYFVSSITFGILIENALSVFFGKNFFAFPNIFEKTTVELGGISFSKMDMVVLAVSIVLLALLMLLINKTRIGLAIRAVAQDSRTAKLMGINSGVIITLSFLIAGALAGVSGVFMGVKYTIYPTLGSSIIFKAFIASVIGGLGSLSGAIIGAFGLGILEMLLVFFFGSSITPALIFAIVLIFLFIRPQGISGKLLQDKA